MKLAPWDTRVNLPGLGVVAVEHGARRHAEGFLFLKRGVTQEGRYFVTTRDELSTTRESTARYLESLAGDSRSSCLVARRGAIILGVVVVVGEPLSRLRHVGRLEIMVAREARGRGLGNLLMGEAIAWAERSDLRKLTLAVFADNLSAVRLYERHGFHVEGRRVGEYLMEDGTLRDDLLMARDVSGSR